MPRNRNRDERGLASLRSRWLGRQLRVLREENGLTLRHVAAISGLDYSLIRQVEAGQQVLSVRGVRALIDCYRIRSSARREHLLGLAAAAAGVFAPNLIDAAGWPDDDEPVTLLASASASARVDVWWLETIATRIRSYGSILVPDLLRTCDYQAAVLAGGRTPTNAHTVRAGWLHQRQRTVIGGLSGGLHAVVTEQALRLPVGGAPVLAQQLKHLLEACRDPHTGVRVWVLATQVGWRPGMDGSFTVIDLPDTYPGPVAVTQSIEGLTVYEAAAARRYAAVFDDLTGVALRPDVSLDLLASMT